MSVETESTIYPTSRLHLSWSYDAVGHEELTYAMTSSRINGIFCLINCHAARRPTDAVTNETF